MKLKRQLENVSDKIIAESKKETNLIGDSDREQIYRLYFNNYQ